MGKVDYDFHPWLRGRGLTAVKSGGKRYLSPMVARAWHGGLERVSSGVAFTHGCAGVALEYLGLALGFPA